jgi:hypothetical protein
MRRRYYVDRLVQGRLLVIMVLLEIAMFTCAMLVAYMDLNSAAALQQASAPGVSSSAIVVHELLRIVPWVLVANLIMVLFVGRVWGRYVTSIVVPLRSLLAAVERLDLRGNGRIDSRHEALTIGRRWILSERERCVQIQDKLSAMSIAAGSANGLSAQQLRAALAEVESLLPVSR